MFRIIIFTSSDQEYADTVIDKLDHMNCIYDRLYRHDLTWDGGSVCKDIQKKSKDISQCLIIDDTPEYIKHKENFIYISPFLGFDTEDKALMNLVDFFKEEIKGREAEFDLRTLASKYSSKK